MVKKQSRDDFIKKSFLIFKGKLDYSKVNYINSRTEVILICKKHGEFSIKPKDHISYKRGCSICKGIKYNLQSFIAAANLLHNNKYSYDEAIFNGVKNKVIITCKKHGNFYQTPDKHLNSKQGCPKCRKNSRKDLSYIIDKGTEIHKGFYDYSLVKFTRMFDPILIGCPLHGIFKQLPINHINNKHRCPACAIGKSKKEIMWLDQIKIPNDQFHRTVSIFIKNKKFIVDGFNPKTNTVYEFYGDFWHGNPKIYKPDDVNNLNHISFGKLYKKTLEREKLLLKNGYNIVSIWEEEFDRENK